jgi:hypothetical protein
MVSKYECRDYNSDCILKIVLSCGQLHGRNEAKYKALMDAADAKKRQQVEHFAMAGADLFAHGKITPGVGIAP